MLGPKEARKTMPIEGFLPLLLAGLLGALLHEGAKLLAAKKETQDSPNTRAVLASIFVVAVGALVPLIYGLDERPFLEAAQLGVGIPALISAGFRISTAADPDPNLVPGSNGGSVWRYLGWRFD